MSKELAGIWKGWEVKVRKSQAAAKKRTISIFTTQSVGHVDDEVEDDAEVFHVEKVFSNGDIYMGQWAGDKYPHGNGKYLWSDGCMYFGEWYKGKNSGKGMFSWPSGATYEGQFKNCYMDGEGIFTGSSNDSYKGSWVMNKKQGKGGKRYANGDFYQGEWRNGCHEGQGRYQWGRGHEYTGQWRNGKMSGNGILSWANGSRYEGYWDGGFPKGNGTFRSKDGSFYVGVWSRDQKGISLVPNDDWDPNRFFSQLRECVVCEGEMIDVFPSDKVFSWSNSSSNDHKPSRKNNSSRELGVIRGSRVSMDGRFSNGGNGNGGLEKIRAQPSKRQGMTIDKGHQNYELMLNLQLGIRHSVGRPAPTKSLNLKPTAFDTEEKLWTRFPPEGSKNTPPHQSCEFKWKDYCPLVFRTLRKLFDVDPADYMLSICGNEALRELSSPGKSGSFFYLTNDDKYMIKTMKKAEVKVLKRMLPAYFEHIKAFENTLITKFFGLHCVKLSGPSQKKVRFVIMGNLFCTEVPIHRRFDLKGSSFGRLTHKPDSQIDANTTLKDLDLNFIFRLQKHWFHEFSRQVDRDCDFLEHERIMDYSLLVGISFQESSTITEPNPRPTGKDEPPNCHSDGATPRLYSVETDASLNPTRKVTLLSNS